MNDSKSKANVTIKTQVLFVNVVMAYVTVVVDPFDVVMLQ